MTAVITALNNAPYTFVKVYDSNDGSDFNGAKTLAQIPIVATDSVAIVGGKLQMGPTLLGAGYSGNRATFAPVLKYGRIIAEFTVNASGSYPGVFGRQQGGYDYLSYPNQGVNVNLLGTSGVDKDRPIKMSTGPVTTMPPPGNLCRITLDLLPDIDNTTIAIVRWDDLTAGTFTTASAFNDTSLPSNAPGTWGVWNISNTPQSAGTAYTRVAIYSAQGAVDIAPSTPYLVIADGDSITQGRGTYPAPNDFSTADVTYPAQLSRLLPNLYTVMNVAMNGQKSTDLTGFVPSDITPKVNPAYNKVIVPILVGANDVGQNTDSAAVIYGRITALHAAVKATGALTIAIAPYHAQYAAVFPRAAADYNPTIDGVVALMAANWSSFADGFINPMTDARFADQTTNPLLADRLNINAAGGAYFAAQVQSVIQNILPISPTVPISVSADGRTLSVALSLPASSASAENFALSNAGSFSASSLSADGLTLTLTPRRRVFVAENPTLSYAGSSVIGANGVRMQPFTGLAVTNNSTRRAFGPPAFLNVAYPGFTWPTVAGATGYRLYQNGILVYDTVNAAGANTATSFTDPAAADGRPIDQPTFTVSAYDATGEGPQSGTPDGTAAVLLEQGTVLVTLTDGAVVNGQTVRLSDPQRVIIDDVRYDVPVGVSTLVPPSVRSVLQNVGLIA